MAASYVISGLGLAKANTIGCSFIDRIISCDTTSALETPKNTSAPFIASARFFISVLLLAKNFFCSFKSVLSVVIAPLESNIMRFSFLTPRERYSFAVEIAAAPAPLITT